MAWYWWVIGAQVIVAMVLNNLFRTSLRQMATIRAFMLMHALDEDTYRAFQADILHVVQNADVKDADKLFMASSIRVHGMTKAMDYKVVYDVAAKLLWDLRGRAVGFAPVGKV